MPWKLQVRRWHGGATVRHLGLRSVGRSPPFPQIDIIGAVVIVWRVRGKLSGLFCAILCATIVHSVMHTHMNRLTVLWIGFCLIRPISLCLDSFFMVAVWNRETIYIFMLWFVMVALCNRADHYIFALWFLSSSSFFPRLISAAVDWMSTTLPHMVWP